MIAGAFVRAGQSAPLSQTLRARVWHYSAPMRASPILLAFLLWLSDAADAVACSLVPPEPHTVDPLLRAIDTTPPSAPRVTALRVRRGQGSMGCAGASSCDDLGFLTFELGDAGDDQTPLAELGYRFELASGTLPEGLELPSQAWRPFVGEDGTRTLVLVWIDGATTFQDPLRFSLRLVAVDAAGNESDPTAVPVGEGGDGGCSHGPVSQWLAPLFALALAFGRPRGGGPAVKPRSSR